EGTVAVPRSIALKQPGARTAARARVGCGGGEIHFAAILFPEIRAVVPAYTVVQSQFASHFPGVLKEQPPLRLAVADFRRSGDGITVDAAQKEARVWEAHGPTGKVLAA